MANPCTAPDRVKREYAKRLPRQLVEDHGRKRRYTQEEVDRSARNAGLDIDWICWAYVLCLDEAAFDAIHAALGESCDYVSMHSEMGGYLAEAAKAGRWAGDSFDGSAFDVTAWEWPDVSGWFDFGGSDIGGMDVGGDGGGD